MSEPPPGTLDPDWSRWVRAVDSTGTERRWHVLDNSPSLGAATPAGTLLCVHGNPTWSYMWRRLVGQAAGASPPWRVVAVDHLDMGLSERTGTVRRAAQRVADLASVTSALDLGRRVVTVGHDWGGVLSLGWALEHRDQLAGVVLLNTAVSQPDGARIPAIMQFARVPVLRSAVTVATPLFARTALALAHPALPRRVRAGYLAPYRDRAHRAAIGTFVKDIPLTPRHPSWGTVTGIADGLGALAGVPALLLWGPRDPVFSDVYLRDLRNRLPHAAVHRFEHAGHLLAEDADIAGAVLAWLADPGRVAPPAPARRPASARPAAPAGNRAQDGLAAPGGRDRRPLWAALAERAADPGPALVEARPPGTGARSGRPWPSGRPTRARHWSRPAHHTPARARGGRPRGRARAGPQGHSHAR